MKLKRLFTATLFFAFLLWIGTSCDKDEDPILEIPEMKKLPSLIRCYSIATGVEDITLKIQYDELNRISEWEEIIANVNCRSKVGYEGTTNKVLTITQILQNSEAKTTEYIYSENSILPGEKGWPIKLNAKGLIAQKSTGYVSYSYDYDADNNLSQMKIVSDDLRAFKYNFTYDRTKIGCFKYVNAPQWLIVTMFLEVGNESSLFFAQNIQNSCNAIKTNTNEVSKTKKLINTYSEGYLTGSKLEGEEKVSFSLRYIEAKE